MKDSVRKMSPEQAKAVLASSAKGLYTSYEQMQMAAKARLIGQPLCPGCNEAPQTNRQRPPREHRCGWCGYNYDDGSMPHLVPA